MTDTPTPRQISAHIAYMKAREQYRIAAKGERARKSKALSQAALEVIKADVEAERVERVDNDQIYGAPI
jgi:hypothetical protein